MSDLTEPGEQLPGEQGEPRNRLRLRTRARSVRREWSEPSATPPSPADEAVPEPAPDDAEVDDTVVVENTPVPPAVPLAAPEADNEPEPTGVIRRRRRRRVTQEPDGQEPDVPAPAPVVPQPATTEDAPAQSVPVAEADVAEAAVPEADVAEADTDTAPETVADPEGQAEGGRRRGRRTRRGRGRRGRRGADAAESDPAAHADDEASPVPEAEAGEQPDIELDADDLESVSPVEAVSRPGVDDDTDTVVDADDVVSEDSAETPTRLRTRSRRSGRGRASGGPRSQRRPYGGISEETRRAITEGPPRKMLVTVGPDRTQIAVLEERNLVEHYVTHRRDVSYVGNIYLGRVQNVLPGMEAAFIDIGKGRNGVLYAGEVDYDEADLEGELPRIEKTLRPGQTVLVQVTKDPMGTKGARLTQHLSIAGRYCVLAPGGGMLGISRKLPDAERERLRKILKSIKPDEYGLIVRTAAEDATKEQLQADVDRLVRIWTQVAQRAETTQPLEPVYEEPDLVIRVIRDVFGPEYVELVLDDTELTDQVRSYLADVSPELVDRISAYAGEGQLFDSYEVTNQIRRALEKKVWLASGGYLIVEKTEAMWVIDVNTGKFVGKSNLEETVMRNNLEAAVEIARQLRLRDMGGIIVIDFVDMLVPSNREEVLKRFRRELARDKTKSRVMEISKLGLVQMTRKNVSQGLQESFTTRCDCCDGLGAMIVDSIL